MNSDGYCVVGFTINNKHYGFMLHRIIAEVYLPTTHNLKFLEVNHKDGNKQNNQLYNLEWVTHRKNIQHSFESNLHSINIPVLHKDTGVIYTSISECERHFNIPTGHLWRLLHSHLNAKYKNDHFQLIGDDELDRKNSIFDHLSNTKSQVHSVLDTATSTLYPSMVQCDKELGVYTGRTQYCLLNGIEVIPGHLCKLQIPKETYILRVNSYSKYKLLDII